MHCSVSFSFSKARARLVRVVRDLADEQWHHVCGLPRDRTRSSIPSRRPFQTATQVGEGALTGRTHAEANARVHAVRDGHLVQPAGFPAEGSAGTVRGGDLVLQRPEAHEPVEREGGR